MTALIFLVPISIVATLAAFHLLARFVYDYDVTATYVRVVLFRKIPIYRIPIQDVQAVEVISFRESLRDIFSFKLGNRIYGAALRIRRHRGLPRVVLMSPNDPAEMKAQIMKRIEACQ